MSGATSTTQTTPAPAQARRWWQHPRTWLAAIGLVLLTVAALAPSWLTSGSPTDIDPDHILAGPSWHHLLGTDELGADLLTRIVYGLKLELVIALGSTLAATIAGIITGTAAAMSGRIVRAASSGLATGLLSMPLILLAVLVVASFGASVWSLTVVLAIAFWPQVHLVVRSQVQSLLHRDFVTASHLLGTSRVKIATGHLVPNAVRPLFVLCPQLMSVAILTEAGLSFLGLGVQPPGVTWGVILMNSKNYYQQAPMYAISAGVVITAAALGLMLLGDRFAPESSRRRVGRLRAGRRTP